MKCPVCNTEARIYKATNVIKGDKLIRRMTYVCRNKTCRNFEKEVAKEDIPLEAEVEE